MRKAVPYYRVSTLRQGISGLGLDAQEKSVTSYANAYQMELLPAFVEVESSRNKKRPILLLALEQCKKHKAILLIAKLDRLGRNVAFVSKLMESDVDFIAVDNPTANKLVVHIMAAFAEYERDQISKRTKEALAVAKSRGTRLGTFGATVLAQRNKSDANEFASSMQPIIQKLYQQGYRTVRSITKMLNRKKIKTFKGAKAKWHIRTVYTLLKRIETICSNQKNSKT
jgi:DNA invertase Pin-like site-specific DNA recombinase